MQNKCSNNKAIRQISFIKTVISLFIIAVFTYPEYPENILL